MDKPLALEDDLSWTREPMLFFVGRGGMADRNRSGTVFLEVPPGVPDGEFFAAAFRQHLARRTVPQALSLFNHLRSIWSHHWTDRIWLNFLQGAELPVNFLRTEHGAAAFKAGDLDFNLPIKPTRREVAPSGTPAANDTEAMLMAAIRVTSARAYRLGQLGDAELATTADHAEKTLRDKIETLLRPIGRQFGLNAYHYRRAKLNGNPTPTFDASEGGAEAAIAEMFPEESASKVLDALLRTGMSLNAADRQPLLDDELAQLKGLVFLRRAAHSQELVARSLIRSQEKARKKNKDEGGDPAYQPRITAPTLNRIANIKLLLDRGMPSTMLLVRAALTTGVVASINTFPNRTYLLPLLYAARFIGQVTINQGLGLIPGALTAGGLAAIACNWQDPQVDRADPDIAASLYLAGILAGAGLDPNELYQLASQCLVDREATPVRLAIQQRRFLLPILPT